MPIEFLCKQRYHWLEISWLEGMCQLSLLLLPACDTLVLTQRHMTRFVGESNSLLQPQSIYRHWPWLPGLNHPTASMKRVQYRFVWQDPVENKDICLVLVQWCCNYHQKVVKVCQELCFNILTHSTDKSWTNIDQTPDSLRFDLQSPVHP